MNVVRSRAAVAAIAALVAALAACGGAEEAEPSRPTPSEPATAVETQPAEGATSGPILSLPRAVQETRDAIVEAAHAFDYERLETLLDPATFSYSFGESGDPVGYWQTLEEEGEVPILGDILPVVLSMPFAEQDGIYVWPSVQANTPESWTEEDIAPLRQLYTDEEIDSFRQAGGYLGWRAGIREDGTWLFFVAGD
jgi:hypothetical protein